MTHRTDWRPIPSPVAVSKEVADDFLKTPAFRWTRKTFQKRHIREGYEEVMTIYALDTVAIVEMRKEFARDNPRGVYQYNYMLFPHPQ